MPAPLPALAPQHKSLPASLPCPAPQSAPLALHPNTQPCLHPSSCTPAHALMPAPQATCPNPHPGTRGFGSLKPRGSAGSPGDPEGSGGVCRLGATLGGQHTRHSLGASTLHSRLAAALPPWSTALPFPGAPHNPSPEHPITLPAASLWPWRAPAPGSLCRAAFKSHADISSFRDVSGALSRSSWLINSQTSCSSNCFNLFAYGWGRGERHVALAAFMGTIWKTFITICCSGAGEGRKDFY